MSTPVAGPGQYSRRTDMTQKLRDLPNPDYGEGASYKDLQKAAPMAGQPSTPPMDFASIFGNPADRVVGLGEGSMQPNIPITDGASVGPGAGVEAIAGPADEENARNKAYMIVYEYMANQPGSSDSARNLVRQMKYNL